MTAFPLGVLTPEVGVLTETFIEWDCRHLLPGRTAVVADPPPRGETVLGPQSWTAEGPLLELPTVAGDPPPSQTRQDAVERFLADHGVRALLVQYLDLADRWFDLLTRLRIPVWVRAHGADVSARLDDGYARLSGLAGVLVPTHAMKRRLSPRLLPAHAVHVVAYQVNIPADPVWPAPDADTVRCLTVGRLVAKKGHAGLLHAFAAARAKDRRLRLDIIGGGPLHGELADSVRRLGLARAVRLLGARPPAEVLARTARADIYLQPSVTGPDGDCEGQPLALLQAMAAARPCIVTQHEGIAEMLTDGHSAIVLPEDAPDQLAAALLTLASDPSLRHRLGVRAREIAVAHHSNTVVRQRLLDLLGPEVHA